MHAGGRPNLYAAILLHCKLSPLFVIFSWLIFQACFFPTVARAQMSHLEDAPVDSLAEKIAAKVERHASFTITVTNLSSLDPGIVAGVQSALEKNLQHRGLAMRRGGEVDAKIAVTLSEDLREFIWAAEIRRENVRQVVLVSFAREATAVSGGDAMPKVVLQREIVWQLESPVLDFALWPAEADTGRTARLAILDPEKLAFYDNAQGAWRLDATAPVAHTKPWPRDLRGAIDAAANRAALPGVECTGDFAHPETVRCAESRAALQSGLKDANPKADDAVPGFEGVESVQIASACGRDSLVLASGSGDWTQPDKLQIFELANGQATPIGAALSFPGPVMALRVAPDAKAARAISINLATGRYEASNVTLVCNP